MIAERLADLVENIGISLEELSQKTEIPLENLQRTLKPKYEVLRKDIPLDELLNICECLEIPTNELFQEAKSREFMTRHEVEMMIKKSERRILELLKPLVEVIKSYDGIEDISE